MNKRAPRGEHLPLHSICMCIMQALLFVSALTLLSTCVYSHPGSLDENGGHYERATGDYHYHHGKPAHLHENGICQYDYEDTTDTSYIPHDVNENSAPTRAVVENEAPELPQSDSSFYLKALAALIAIPVTLKLCAKIKSKLAFMSKRNEYMQLYGNKAITELTTIPPGTDIGSDQLPKQSSTNNWGEMYTAYISKTGTVFHRSACNKSATFAVHICNVPSSFTPCKRCNPEKPPLDWYYEYEKILAIKKQYNIS